MNGGDDQDMHYTFNLVDRPWIPCVTMNGRSVHVGLRDLLRKTHDLVEIRSESPLETVSIYRLVLAILHRVFGPRNRDEWASLWNGGHGGWDTSLLDDYLDRWRNRFDLFSEDGPFYQMAGFTANRESPVSRLFHELASGNNPTLFDHSQDAHMEPMTADAVARALVAHQTFAVGGGKSPTGYTSHAPLVGSVAVMLVGDNLFETLMLNLVMYDPKESRPIPASETDRPSWERDDPILPGKRRPVLGYLDLLTWQSRAIRLVPQGDRSNPRVSHLYYGQGEIFDLEGTTDPQVPMVKVKDDMARLRLIPDRAVWRDSTVLVGLNSPDVQPAAANGWVSTLRQRRVLQRRHPIHLSAYGLASGRAKILLWREERIPLPLEYLEDQLLLADLNRELCKAESVGESVDKAIYFLARYLVCPDADDPNAKPDRDAVKRVSSQFRVTSHYWASLEVPFRSLVVDLVDDMEQAVVRWNASIERRAWEALGIALEGIERDARTFKASINARRILGAGIARALGR